MILRAAGLLLVFLVLLFVFKPVRAEPFLSAEAGGVKVIIHTDDCKLKGVENLPKRATYHESGKKFEGCVGLSQELGLFLFYWEDKTVVAIPQSFFARVHGT